MSWPLFAAVHQNDVAELKRIIDNGISPNAVSRDGDMPLHLSNSTELTAALLAAGADPNATNQVKQILPSTDIFVQNSRLDSFLPHADPHDRRPA